MYQLGGGAGTALHILPNLKLLLPQIPPPFLGHHQHHIARHNLREAGYLQGLPRPIIQHHLIGRVFHDGVAFALYVAELFAVVEEDWTGFFGVGVLGCCDGVLEGVLY